MLDELEKAYLENLRKELINTFSNNPDDILGCLLHPNINSEYIIYCNDYEERTKNLLSDISVEKNVKTIYCLRLIELLAFKGIYLAKYAPTNSTLEILEISAKINLNCELLIQTIEDKPFSFKNASSQLINSLNEFYFYIYEILHNGMLKHFTKMHEDIYKHEISNERISQLNQLVQISKVIMGNYGLISPPASYLEFAWSLVNTLMSFAQGFVNIDHDKDSMQKTREGNVYYEFAEGVFKQYNFRDYIDEKNYFDTLDSFNNFEVSHADHSFLLMEIFNENYEERKENPTKLLERIKDIYFLYLSSQKITVENLWCRVKECSNFNDIYYQFAYNLYKFSKKLKSTLQTKMLLLNICLKHTESEIKLIEYNYDADRYENARTLRDKILDDLNTNTFYYEELISSAYENVLNHQQYSIESCVNLINRIPLVIKLSSESCSKISDLLINFSNIFYTNSDRLTNNQKHVFYVDAIAGFERLSLFNDSPITDKLLFTLLIGYINLLRLNSYNNITLLLDKLQMLISKGSIFDSQSEGWERLISCFPILSNAFNSGVQIYQEICLHHSVSTVCEVRTYPQ